MMNVCKGLFLVIAVLMFITLFTLGDAVKCYQCASSQDPKGEDNCGAYKRFDIDRHSPVECNSADSHMPGSFCMKVTQQGIRGFIWDGRWRQTIRRCASVAETGVTGVCNWGVYENGVFWEECYCSEDACNAASNIKVSLLLPLLIVIPFFLL